MPRISWPLVRIRRHACRWLLVQPWDRTLADRGFEGRERRRYLSVSASPHLLSALPCAIIVMKCTPLFAAAAQIKPYAHA